MENITTKAAFSRNQISVGPHSMRAPRAAMLWRPTVSNFSAKMCHVLTERSNLYFAPPSIEKLEESSNIVINVKDQDFSISKEIILKSRVSNNEDWQESTIYVPIVSIECKTYLDKTMYEGSVSTAEKIKKGNPYCVFLIVTETYEVSHDVDPKYSLIDQIYVLRKDDAQNPFCDDVICDLFKFVEWKLIPTNEKLREIHSNITKYGRFCV